MRSVSDILFYQYFQFCQKGWACSRWKTLERSQWLPAQKLLELRRQKLSSLLQDAVRNVPYYHKVYGGRFDELKTNPDLTQFPILTKDVLAGEYQNLKHKDLLHRHAFENSTSGSTGRRTSFIQDAHYSAAANACAWRSCGWVGVKPTDPQAVLWGAAFDKRQGSRLWERVKKFIIPLEFCCSYDLSEEKLDSLANALIVQKVKCLTSYPSPLVEFADFVRRKGVKFPHLKAVISSAEQLFPHQRELFETVFQCPVFNRYGSREFGTIAHECEAHDGLHVAAEHVEVEILDSNLNPCEPLQTGDLYITCLDNFSMPLIRYQIGDAASWAENRDSCPCGRSLPRLAAIDGRSFDVIHTAAGCSISGTFWTLLTRHVSADIAAFQVRQRSLSHIDLLLQTESGKELGEEEKRQLLEQIKDKAPDMDVNLVYVDQIPLTKAGKRRFVIREFDLGEKI